MAFEATESEAGKIKQSGGELHPVLAAHPLGKPVPGASQHLQGSCKSAQGTVVHSGTAAVMRMFQSCLLHGQILLCP